MTHPFKIKVILRQRDFFEQRTTVFRNRTLIKRGSIRYLSLNDVLELLEYDYLRQNRQRVVVTDGSQLITLFLNSGMARREGVTFHIDPLITLQDRSYVSLRSINRLFNVDISVNLLKKQMVIHQPGNILIAFRGDTLRSISKLLNVSIKRLLAVNKRLKEPIATCTRIRIPTFNINAANPNKVRKRATATIKQTVVEKAGAIISSGRRLRGIPYKFGAGPYSRTRKFDCSSFTQYIFGINSIRLPRTARAQSTVGSTIRRKDIEPGDLIFFHRDRYSDNRIGHVGVDIGNGRMLNTYNSPPGVTTTVWRSPYWLSRYVTAREIL